MALDKEQVEKLAELAKLSLTPEEVTTYQHQLEEVLHYVEKISQLDLAEVPLSVSGVAAHDIAAPRSDEVEKYSADLVRHACQSQDNFIVSPPVLKK